MLRPLISILCGLNAAAPSFPHKAEAAPLVRDLAAEHGHDPFTTIAYVESESGWIAGSINPRSGATGLGQVLPKDDADQLELLGWRYNLKRTAVMFHDWRAICERRVGTGLLVYWMQGMKGWDAVRGTVCGHVRVGKRWKPLPIPKAVTKMAERRRELVRRCQ